jgi:ankyrin repeat protein
VNLKDNEGDTALTLAAGRVNVDVLRVLIEAGAKVNAKNTEGQTALMAAAQEGLVENVRALVLAGADMSLKNKDGDTAFKLARDNEHEDVASLLAAFGTDE